MATDSNSDTARILKFTRPWQGRFEASDFERDVRIEAHATALHDARQIIAARREADNWMATLLLGMLAAMDGPALLRAEVAIGAHADCNAAARQALALIRLANCGKEHRARVLSAIDVLQERENG